MKLEQLIFSARPRTPWETVDLGFKLAHRFWRSLLLSWLAVTLPVFVLCLLFLPAQEYLATVLWWLKPLFERCQLYVLSRGIFAECPTVWQTLGAFPRYAKTQLIAALTWRRLSPTRSFDLAVTQLEGLGGSRRAERLRVLHASNNGVGGLLTVVLVHIESILLLAMLTGIAMMIPSTIDMGWMDIVTEQIWLFNLVYFLAISLIAPFYVASGFALYLNRRIELEGWDIELGFRQIAEQSAGKATRRFPGVSGGIQSMLLTALLPLAVLLPAPEPLLAETMTERQVVEQNVRLAQERITEVFKGEVFHQIETSRVPKFPDLDSDEQATRTARPEWLKNLIITIANSIEVILWSLVLLGILYLLVRYRDWITQWFGSRNSKDDRLVDLPETLMGLKVTPASLPADVAGQAGQLLAAGRQRDCLSLLYRGALASFLSDYQLSLSASDTELQCLAIVQKTLANPNTARADDQSGIDIPDYFRDLTHRWQQLAYGRNTPSDTELKHLCEQWRVVFSNGREE